MTEDRAAPAFHDRVRAGLRTAVRRKSVHLRFLRIVTQASRAFTAMRDVQWLSQQPRTVRQNHQALSKAARGTADSRTDVAALAT
jgi:hypothetical protein